MNDVAVVERKTFGSDLNIWLVDIYKIPEEIDRILVETSQP